MPVKVSGRIIVYVRYMFVHSVQVKGEDDRKIGFFTTPLFHLPVHNSSSKS